MIKKEWLFKRLQNIENKIKSEDKKESELIKNTLYDLLVYILCNAERIIISSEDQTNFLKAIALLKKNDLKHEN